MDTEIPMMQYQPSNNMMMMMDSSSNNNNSNSNSNSNNQPQTTTTSIINNEVSVIRYAGRQAVCQFLQHHHCTTILKTSSKMIVFDILTPIQLAFYALVEHDTLCAPLWDSRQNIFVGIFTVTDFIDLLYYYSFVIHKDVTLLNNESIESIIYFLKQQQSLSSVSSSSGGPESTDSVLAPSSVTTNTIDTQQQQQQSFIPFQLLHPFYGASTNCTLYNACIQLLTSTPTQHFLPIVFVDDMRILSCITYTTILEFLVTHFREQRRLFDDSIIDLHIGTYGDDVIRITTHDTLQTAIQRMTKYQLSAIPVVDVQPPHKIIAMYSHSDITFLTRAIDAEDAVRNLQLPMYDILNASNPNPPITTTTMATTTTTTQPSSSSGTPSVGTATTTGTTPPVSVSSSTPPVPVPPPTTTSTSTTATPPPSITANTTTTSTAAATGGGILSTTSTTTPDALRTCLPHHTLQYIFESFAIQRFNRLCIIDEVNESIIGIVSAKDLVQYFLSDTIQLRINNNNNNTNSTTTIQQ